MDSVCNRKAKSGKKDKIKSSMRMDMRVNLIRGLSSVSGSIVD